ncbi:hypothetical protein L1887_54057 [Cichorium endivia]|nr:hypothetical protein L1887_54057 [Cichorium endivia]
MMHLRPRHVGRQQLIVQAALEMADALGIRVLTVSRCGRSAAETHAAAEHADVAVVVRGVVALDGRRLERLGHAEPQQGAGVDGGVACVLLVIVKEAHAGKALRRVAERGVVHRVMLRVRGGCGRALARDERRGGRAEAWACVRLGVGAIDAGGVGGDRVCARETGAADKTLRDARDGGRGGGSAVVVREHGIALARSGDARGGLEDGGRTRSGAEGELRCAAVGGLGDHVAPDEVEAGLGEAGLEEVKVERGRCGTGSGAATDGYAAGIDPECECGGEPVEREAEHVGLVRVHDLALVGFGSEHRGEGAEEVDVGTLACGMELPCDGALCGASLWLGGVPAALTARLECILERGSECGERLGGDGRGALDVCDEADDVFDGGGDFVDHGCRCGG